MDASHLHPYEQKYQTNSNIDGQVGVKTIPSTIAQPMLQFADLGCPKHPVFVTRVVCYYLVALRK